MLVRDTIYGEFRLPSFLEPLIYAPEFQRLKSVRLLNIDSPTVAALSDVSRHSHTLGTLYLASQAGLLGHSREEVKALLAALIFHDVGTPPFGHLVEYQLRDRFGFSHEKILAKYIDGTHHPDTTSHQVGKGGRIRFAELCSKAGIDVGIVRSILTLEHPFSRLIFGDLDFDNLDNVARMAWFLGLRPDASQFIGLARELNVRFDGSVLLPKSAAENVKAWAACRRRSYDVLVFDSAAVARQAVVSEAIGICLREGTISADDWSWVDDELLDHLGASPAAKTLLRRYYYNMPPRHAVHLRVSRGAMGSLPAPSVAREHAEAVLNEFYPGRTHFTYVFADRGTFEKRVAFTCPSTDEQWSVGEQSLSLVVDGFVAGSPGSVNKQRAAAEALRERLG